MRISPIQQNLYRHSYCKPTHKGNTGKVVGTIAGGALGAAALTAGSVLLGPLGLFMGAVLVGSGASSGAIGGMLYDQAKEAKKENEKKS